MPKIVAQLHGHEPPFDVAATVRRLLGSVPAKYLTGLGSVVITHSMALSSPSRKRVYRYASGRRVRIGDCPAYYQPGSGSESPHIALMMDKLLASWRPGVLRLPIFRDMAIADCLYHEIGHHVHATQRPARKDGEIVADQWRLYLFGQHWRRHYRFLRPLWPLIRRVAMKAGRVR